jgi:hypothetical protein
MFYKKTQRIPAPTVLFFKIIQRVHGTVVYKLKNISLSLYIIPPFSFF